MDSKYELLVGSSHIDLEFSFDIDQNDAQVLNEDLMKQAMFRCLLYFSLQDVGFKTPRKSQSELQNLFQNILKIVLYSSSQEIDEFISQKSTELNTVINLYIKKDYDKLVAGAKYTAWGIR